MLVLSAWILVWSVSDVVVKGKAMKSNQKVSVSDKIKIWSSRVSSVTHGHGCLEDEGMITCTELVWVAQCHTVG